MDYKKIQVFFFLGILALVLFATILIFLPYLYAVIFAITLAVIVYPIYLYLQKFFKKRKGIASMLVVIIVLLIMLIPLVLLGFLLVKEITQVYSHVAQNNVSYLMIDKAEKFINQYFPSITIDLRQNFDAYLKDTLTFLLKNIGSLFSNVINLFLGFFLVLFALYYLLKDGKKLVKAVVTYSPLADKYDKQILSKLSVAVNSVLKGSLLISIIQGILAGIGFWIFGVPNPALLGAVTVIASLIPAVGTAIIIIPACLYLFLTSHFLAGLGLLLWGLLLVGLIDNFLRPKLIEKDIHLHPFLILLSVIGGISLFGPFGFILGPLVLSLFFALLDIYKEEFKDYIE